VSVGIDLVRKAQARVAAERGAVAVSRAARVRFALAFPNVYSVGMASLGFQLVYRMLNDLPDASCERVFLPDPPDLEEHLRTGAELFTLESQSPLAEFDVIGFSLAFEMDYLNVLRMLRPANVPIRSAERDETHPLVIAGGPCATFNPEPLADFVDAFVIGDAEEVIPELVGALLATEERDRVERLAALAGVGGVYVPRFYEPEYGALGELVRVRNLLPAQPLVKRPVCRGLSKFPAKSCIYTADAQFGEITLVEVARGCGRGCRFCVTGQINRPPRPRKFVGKLDGMRLGLVGAAVFDHPGAVDLCRRIVAAGGEFTVSSVRLETVTPEVANLLAAGGQRTVTIAPEAGSERLRRVINKHCTDDQILAAVSAARDAGLEKVKLYFMIGLPTETQADVESIPDLLRRLAREFPSLEFQASVSSFVPKPWTPFQWHPMERETVLKRRYATLSREIGAIRGVAFSGESPRLAMIQGLLARGDRRVGQVLETSLENDGDYRGAIRATGLDMAWYVHRQRACEEILPWDHIDIGIEKGRLWNEYQEAGM